MGSRPESVAGARLPGLDAAPVFYIIRTRLEYAFSEV